jgi:hypothetical protein
MSNTRYAAPSKVVNHQPNPPKKRYGLGDVIEGIAHPIAVALDSVVGTNISSGCDGCRRRKEALNNAVPDIRHPLST